MSRVDVMGLGPFLKALQVRLERMPKEEICRAIVARAKTLRAVDRRAFLAGFENVPPPTPGKPAVGDDACLIADIREFITDLENGKYYEGSGFDSEVRDYRSYGDESWVEEMDGLFDRAAHAFLGGNKALAAEAYGLLLHAFEMEEEFGHFCGATRATEMVATDLDEAKARYFRALYGTTPGKERPAALWKELHALRYCGNSDPSIKAFYESEAVPPPEWNVFLDGWIAFLRELDFEGSDLLKRRLSQALLREAIMLRDGVVGLAKLADERGAADPEAFQTWIDELVRLDRKNEAMDVARRAASVVCQPHDRATFAERWASLANNAEDAAEARRVAWRWSPTISRLLLLQEDGAPSPRESDARIAEEWGLWRSGNLELKSREAGVLAILAGEYDEAGEVLAESDPTFWGFGDHPGPVVYPMLLLAIAGSRPLPKGSVLSLWRHELEACERISLVPRGVPDEAGAATQTTGLASAMQGVIQRKPVEGDRRERILALTRKVMLAYVGDIAKRQQRGLYDSAARMLVGWLEAARIAGRAAEAESLLEQIRKGYSRRPAFRREIDSLTGAN